MITKRPEPRSLAEFRATPGASFSGFGGPAKDELRSALVAEQRHLCCYRMNRIRTDETTRIEHWAPRKHAELQLDYKNLLSACSGGTALRPSEQHCDVRKAEQSIGLDPRAPSPHASQMRYDDDGTIDIEDAGLRADVHQRLNLNHRTLKANRKGSLASFVAALRRDQGKNREWPRAALEKARRQLEDPHAAELRPYVEVLLYWIRRRIGPA